MFRTTIKQAKDSLKSFTVPRSRVAYVALNDGLRITLSRSKEQNKVLLHQTYGMPEDKANDFAEAIEKVFYYGSL